jgi:16S rRNA (guanine527-N7)-methyltransferase
VFGAALPVVQRFADALVGPAIERGLLGPAEADRVWERHLLNCAPVSDLIAANASVIDVGSGAGLPGLVVALLRPDLTVTLLDAQLRRCTFLTEMVDLLELGNRVTVVHGRAEDGLTTVRHDYATMRALAPLERLLPLCAPLIRRNGELLAIKGSSAGDEVAAAKSTLKRYDAQATICQLDLPGGGGTTTVVRVVVGQLQPGGTRKGTKERRERKPG